MKTSKGDDLIRRQTKKKSTSEEDYLMGRRPYMKQPLRKITSNEVNLTKKDDLRERQPHRKTTSKEDDLTG